MGLLTKGYSWTRKKKIHLILKKLSRFFFLSVILVLPRWPALFFFTPLHIEIYILRICQQYFLHVSQWYSYSVGLFVFFRLSIWYFGSVPTLAALVINFYFEKRGSLFHRRLSRVNLFFVLFRRVDTLPILMSWLFV